MFFVDVAWFYCKSRKFAFLRRHGNKVYLCIYLSSFVPRPFGVYRNSMPHPIATPSGSRLFGARHIIVPLSLKQRRIKPYYNHTLPRLTLAMQFTFCITYLLFASAVYFSHRAFNVFRATQTKHYRESNDLIQPPIQRGTYKRN